MFEELVGLIDKIKDDSIGEWIVDKENDGTLEHEKMRLVKMVANKESQQSVADEIGISRRTLRGRKDDVMSELAKKLDNHR